MLNPKMPTSGAITWDFVITEQLKVSRYGHMGPDYYKQFTPYGVEWTLRHPAQRIDRRTYEMAKRIHDKKPVTVK
jgi:hypothetical protein